MDGSAPPDRCQSFAPDWRGGQLAAKISAKTHYIQIFKSSYSDPIVSRKAAKGGLAGTA